MNSTSRRSKIRNTAAEFKATERGVEIPLQKGTEMNGVTDKDFMDIMFEGTSKVGSDNILYDRQGRAIGKLDGNAYREYIAKEQRRGIER